MSLQLKMTEEELILAITDLFNPSNLCVSYWVIQRFHHILNFESFAWKSRDLAGGIKKNLRTRQSETPEEPL